MAEPKQNSGAFPEMPEGQGSDETIDIEALAREYEQAAADGVELEDVVVEEPAAPTGPNVDALVAERDELQERFMRALAEAENARKRGERDRREGEKYGSSKLARDMLPVFDNLTRALEAVSEEQREHAAALFEGVELTMRELVNIFGKHGITPIKPEPGDVFDPQQHQAMFEAPVPGTKAGEIIQVMAHGFMIHDRLLRPAQVGVSSTPAG